MLFLVAGFCCFPAKAMASKGVTFTWQRDVADDLEGYRLYYGKKSRSYDYFVDLGEMAHCSTDRDHPGCEALDVTELSCVDMDSENPRCLVKGLPGGLNYFALTAYNDRVESAYSIELKGELDKDGNLVSLKPAVVRKYAHLDATYNLLLR